MNARKDQGRVRHVFKKRKSDANNEFNSTRLKS